MKKYRLLFALLLSTVLLSGCGGGEFILFNPFEGFWTGTWDGNVADGPVFFEIDVLGELNGTMHSNTAGVDGSLTGLVLENGDATLTVTFPNENPAFGTGMFVLGGDGTTLTGTIDFDGDNITFDMTKG